MKNKWKNLIKSKKINKNKSKIRYKGLSIPWQNKTNSQIIWGL